MSETEGEWTVEGVIRCPDCGLYLDVDGPLPDLGKLITAHDCAEERDHRD